MQSTRFLVGFTAFFLLGSQATRLPVYAQSTTVESSPSEALGRAMKEAGENRAQLEKALADVAPEHRVGMQFLIVNMPERDLKSLTADYLKENVEYAYRAWKEAPWYRDVPEEIFLNQILPYVAINERRDNWRKDFYERFQPLVANAKSPGEAAAILNQKIFGIVSVKYSTRRPKADQSPLESIKAGLASCSGLSVILIDACRAVGVPARFVGTPLWSDNSGNHSWVEVWDNGWHFTGAAEPSGDKLDQAWFTDRASKAIRDDRRRAIYATSFKRTPITFPLVWDNTINYVYAVNVTDRYSGKTAQPPEGSANVFFRVGDEKTGDRCKAKLVIKLGDSVVTETESRDERFDANDHASAILKLNEKYSVTASLDDRSITYEFTPAGNDELISLTLP